MIYVLNNILFGNPKLSKYQLDYFNNYFIQTVEKYPPDKILIYNNIFYNSNNITFSLLNKVKDIFTCLSNITKIEVIDNDYCSSIIKDWNIHVVDSNDYEQPNLTLPKPNLFQLSKDDQTIPGFLIAHQVKSVFVENKHTPRFVDYSIETIDDLNNFVMTKDIINLTINSELFSKAEYVNRIDIFLNNNKFNNVFYTEKTKDEEKVVLDSKNINIRNILVTNIEDDLKDELKEVFDIYDEKNNEI